MNKSWFTASISDGAANISIYDEIGLYGINAKDFAKEFKALGNIETINLHLNSPGGEVFDGLAIYSMLKRSSAYKNIYIDGLAASIASVIAMAGDNIIMPENAMMMIHDPSGFVVGTSKEMRDLADAMDKIKTAMISAYGSQTDLTRQEIADLMSKETWLTAQEAVDMGFATQIEKPIQMAANFNLSKFKHSDKFTAHIQNSQAIQLADVTEDHLQQKENNMTNETVIASDTVEEVAAVAENTTTASPEASTPEPKTEEKIDVSDIVAKAKEEERKRAADIFAVCQMTGKQDLAAQYVESGKSLSEVVAIIKNEKVTAAPEINVRNSSGSAQPVVYSWDKAIQKLNSKKKS